MDNQNETLTGANTFDIGSESSSESSLTILHPSDIRDTIAQARSALETELTGTPAESFSKHDGALLRISEPDMTFSLIDTLEHNKIDTIEIDSEALSDPRSALQSVFEAGDAALSERGIPSPDVGFYHQAQHTAQETGQDMRDVLKDMHDATPLIMRTDLSPPEAIQTLPDGDTVYAAPEVEGPVAETQYDVHFMGYPIEHRELMGVPITDSMASHGFVVVTERGMNPIDLENVLLATRAGPDNAGQTIFVSDSSLPDDEQSPTEKTNSGNVYVADNQFSRVNDANHNGRFHIETTEVTHDLDTMRDMVDNHRALINNTDIDYEVLNRNSNTYAGDSYRILTGQESQDFGFHDWKPRYFPAINNDLMDYSKTEFAENFGYAKHETEMPSHDHQQHFLPEEDNSYGLD